MSLEILDYMKLPDVPPQEHRGMYDFLTQLQRIVSRMRGDVSDSARVITYGDLPALGLTQPRWDDMRFPAISQQVDISAGRLDYDYVNCGVSFDATSRYPEDPICHIVQLPHSKRIGTELRPHIHWEQNQAATPNWLIEWRWVNNGELRGTYQQAAIVDNAFAYASGNLQQISVFPTIPPIVREKTSSIMDVRIFRDSGNVSGLFAGADAYTGGALLKEFDIHYQVDSFGSQLEYTKI